MESPKELSREITCVVTLTPRTVTCVITRSEVRCRGVEDDGPQDGHAAKVRVVEDARRGGRCASHLSVMPVEPDSARALAICELLSVWRTTVPVSTFPGAHEALVAKTPRKTRRPEHHRLHDGAVPPRWSTEVALDWTRALSRCVLHSSRVDDRQSHEASRIGRGATLIVPPGES